MSDSSQPGEPKRSGALGLDELQVAVLLHEKDALVRRVMDMKNEEMVWVRVVWLVFAAVIFFMALPWLPAHGSAWSPRDGAVPHAGVSRSLLYMSVIVVPAMTVFSFVILRMMLSLRESYYRRWAAIHRIEQMLGLHDATRWGKARCAVYAEQDIWICAPNDGCSERSSKSLWQERTKPKETAFARYATVCGLYATVWTLAVANVLAAATARGWIFVVAITLNFFIVYLFATSLVLWLDHRRLRARGVTVSDSGIACAGCDICRPGRPLL